MPEREISMAGEGKTRLAREKRHELTRRRSDQNQSRTEALEAEEYEIFPDAYGKDFADFARQFRSGSEELWLLNHPEFRSKPH